MYKMKNAFEKKKLKKKIENFQQNSKIDEFLIEIKYILKSFLQK